MALWSGEEQGLLGSQAYVKEHFGAFENPKPGFNIDSGTGRVRGAGAFGPPEAALILRDILKPFKDDGMVGAVSTRSRNLGGSDNTFLIKPDRPASAWVRIRSSTEHTPGTPTSTHTNASSKTM